tara:strand:+ start:4438 stop:4704 length:267 start_codon:yes stop_codon:yes gene_type:complete
LNWVRVLAGRGNDKGYTFRQGKYQVKVRNGVEDFPVHIGYFNTEIEAQKVFIEHKISLIKVLIKEYEHDTMFRGLLDEHIKILREVIT